MLLVTAPIILAYPLKCPRYYILLLDHESLLPNSKERKENNAFLTFISTGQRIIIAHLLLKMCVA
jgi:hypothetical protein